MNEPAFARMHWVTSNWLGMTHDSIPLLYQPKLFALFIHYWHTKPYLKNSKVTKKTTSTFYFLEESL